MRIFSVWIQNTIKIFLLMNLEKGNGMKFMNTVEAPIGKWFSEVWIQNVFNLISAFMCVRRELDLLLAGEMKRTNPNQSVDEAMKTTQKQHISSNTQ